MMYKTLNKIGRELIVCDNGDIRSAAFKNARGDRMPERKLKSTKDSRGYRRIGIALNGVRATFYSHRLVAEAFLDNYSDELDVDHINGDKSTNKAQNLRMLTRSQNTTAHRNQSIQATSGYRGVSKAGNKFRAYICKGGDYKHLGTFANELEAAKVFDSAAVELDYLPESLNFPLAEMVS